jgi:hypothetical protein
VQPPSSGADPYYPPTSGAPGSPPPGYPSFPADAGPSGGYGSGSYGAPSGYRPSPTSSFAAPPTTTFGAPPPGGFGAPPGGFGAPPGGFGAPPPAPPPSPAKKPSLLPLILGIVVALAVVGAGCFAAGYMFGRQGAETSTAPAPAAGTPKPGSPSRGAPSTAAKPDGVAGKWTGTYTCSQGETGLTLTIQGPDTELRATFAFYPVSGSGEKGSYKMGGALNGGTMRLIGTEWIQQPEGFGMVNLSSSNVTATTITGKVEADGCTDFSVKRA